MLARLRKSLDERGEGGFTLIELLVVIIIIGILAAIAIPVFLNQRNKATESGMKSDLRSLANEMESYYTDKQVYPPNAEVLLNTTTLLVTVGTGGSTVKVSDKNTAVTSKLTGDPVGGSYCLAAVNSRIVKNWYYNSASGGLTQTAC